MFNKESGAFKGKGGERGVGGYSGECEGDAEIGSTS